MCHSVYQRVGNISWKRRECRLGGLGQLQQAAGSGLNEGRGKGHARSGKIAGSRDAGPPRTRTHARTRALASHSIAAEKVLPVAARAKTTKFGAISLGCRRGKFVISRGSPAATSLRRGLKYMCFYGVTAGNKHFVISRNSLYGGSL